MILPLSAGWCMPCETLNPFLAEFAKENPRLKILGLDLALAYMIPADVKKDFGNSLPRIIVLKKARGKWKIDKRVADIPVKAEGIVDKAKVREFLKDNLL